MIAWTNFYQQCRIRVCKGEVVEGAKRSFIPFASEDLQALVMGMKGVSFKEAVLECCTIDIFPLLL